MRIRDSGNSEHDQFKKQMVFENTVFITFHYHSKQQGTLDGTDLCLVRVKAIDPKGFIKLRHSYSESENLNSGSTSVIIDFNPFHGALYTANNLFDLKRVAKLRALKNSFPPPGYERNEGQFSFRLTLL